MKKTKNYFAIVIDEYGGLSGIVTITDLLESIVGDIYDEEDSVHKAPDIEPLDSKTWRISGKAPIDDVEKTLGLTLECDYDTFAGYVLTVLGSLPEDGTISTVLTENLSIRITSVRDHRIENTMVSLLETPEGINVE
jgi:putative hemolysin